MQQESKFMESWVVFTDGACSGNPGSGGWSAILVSPLGEVKEIGGGEIHTTNNRMELMALIGALELIKQMGREERVRVGVFTDSTYMIRGATQWIWGWKKKGWITAEGKEVANTELWKRLFSLVAGFRIEWGYVRGHAGIPGNERADEIAVQFSKGISPQLYRGKLLNYPIAIYDIPENTDLPEKKPTDTLKTKKNPKAYSYLSCVGGQLMRHTTWADCEKRIRGQSGARFKKAMSLQDEGEILQSWGFSKNAI